MPVTGDPFNPTCACNNFAREKLGLFVAEKSNSGKGISQVYPPYERYFKGGSNFGGKGDDTLRPQGSRSLQCRVNYNPKGEEPVCIDSNIADCPPTSTSRIINRT